MSGAHRPLGTGRRDYDLPTGKGKSFRATDLTQVGTLAKEGEKGRVLPTIRIGGPDGCPPLLRQRGNASLLLGPARDHLGLLVWILRWLEHVAARRDAHRRLFTCGLEAVRALFQLPPKADVRIGAVLDHVLGRHPERISLELECRLPTREGVARKSINFGDLLVRHGVAARRRAGAVHHQVPTRAAVCAVIGVRKPDVEGQVVGRVRVQLRGRDRIEALGRLPVALRAFGTELARPAADRKGLDEDEASVAGFFPDLELGFLLIIPSPGDQNLWAQSLRPMDIMSQGRSVSLFHASQQWSRMSP